MEEGDETEEEKDARELATLAVRCCRELSEPGSELRRLVDKGGRVDGAADASAKEEDVHDGDRSSVLDEELTRMLLSLLTAKMQTLFE